MVILVEQVKVIFIEIVQQQLIIVDMVQFITTKALLGFFNFTR